MIQRSISKENLALIQVHMINAITKNQQANQSSKYSTSSKKQSSRYPSITEKQHQLSRMSVPFKRESDIFESQIQATKKNWVKKITKNISFSSDGGDIIPLYVKITESANDPVQLTDPLENVFPKVRWMNPKKSKIAKEDLQTINEREKNHLNDSHPKTDDSINFTSRPYNSEKFFDKPYKQLIDIYETKSKSISNENKGSKKFPLKNKLNVDKKKPVSLFINIIEETENKNNTKDPYENLFPQVQWVRLQRTNQILNKNISENSQIHTEREKLQPTDKTSAKQENTCIKKFTVENHLGKSENKNHYDALESNDFINMTINDSMKFLHDLKPDRKKKDELYPKSSKINPRKVIEDNNTLENKKLSQPHKVNENNQKINAFLPSNPSADKFYKLKKAANIKPSQYFLETGKTKHEKVNKVVRTQSIASTIFRKNDNFKMSLNMGNKVDTIEIPPKQTEKIQFPLLSVTNLQDPKVKKPKDHLVAFSESPTETEKQENVKLPSKFRLTADQQDAIFLSSVKSEKHNNLDGYRPNTLSFPSISKEPFITFQCKKLNQNVGLFHQPDVDVPRLRSNQFKIDRKKAKRKVKATNLLKKSRQTKPSNNSRGQRRNKFKPTDFLPNTESDRWSGLLYIMLLPVFYLGIDHKDWTGAKLRQVAEKWFHLFLRAFKRKPDILKQS